MNLSDLQNKNALNASSAKNQNSLYATPSRRQEDNMLSMQGSSQRSHSRQDKKFFNTNQTIRRSEIFNASKYVCKELDADEIIKLREVFIRWDQDGNGSLSPMELKLALMQYDKNVSQQQVMQILGILDSQGKGGIEFEEFVNAFKQKTILDSIEKVYNFYDLEKKGFITFNDLKIFTQRKLKQKEDDSLLQSIIQIVGLDDKITKQQFQNVMLEYFKQIR